MPIQKWSDEIWIVQLTDEPALSDDLTAVKDDAEGVDVYPNILIDLTNTSHLTSSNLSQLLRLRKQAIDYESKLKLAGIGDPVWVVFMTTGLDKVFDFAPDVPTALAGLQLDDPTNH